MPSDRFQIEVEETWRDDVELYQPRDVEQILLPDYAVCLAAKAFFKINNLKFKTVMCENAEMMLPVQRELPLLRFGNMLYCGFTDIVDFVNAKQITTSKALNDIDRNEMRTFTRDITINLFHAELYFTWLHDDTYNRVTKKRYSYHLPWPLNIYCTWLKRNEVRTSLKATKIHKSTEKDICGDLKKLLEALSNKLGDNKYFYEKPTELDAWVYGHLFAILTTELPNSLSSIVNEFTNLVDLVNRIDCTYFGKGDNFGLNVV